MAKRKTRVITLEVEVEIPANIGESEVEAAINAALEEPPCEWGDWSVGAAVITKARNERRDW